MSLGVACFPQDAKTPKDLIHEADLAVYQAKHQGRNRVVMATDVPQAIKQAGIPGPDRLNSPQAAAVKPRPAFEQNDA